jgi:hypothetical protein
MTFVARGLQLLRLHAELDAAAHGQMCVTLVEGPASRGTHAPTDPPGGHVEAGVRRLAALGGRVPLIVLVDDAHWADADGLRAEDTGRLQAAGTTVRPVS